MISRAKIQAVRSLADKDARSESGLFVVEGRKMVGEALSAGAGIERIYAVDGLSAGLDLPEGLVDNVSPGEMERMSRLRTPSDVLAVVRMPRRSGGDMLRGGLVLCLDGVQDPGNLGTMIRIADWFGIDRVLCSPDSADCFNPKAVQATMGAVFRVETVYVPIAETLGVALERGLPVYGTFLDGEDIYGAELAQDGVVVMGSEGHGISPAAAAMVNRRLFIPPFPSDRHGSESLNVAAATAVVCAEFRRRARIADRS